MKNIKFLCLLSTFIVHNEVSAQEKTIGLESQFDTVRSVALQSSRLKYNTDNSGQNLTIISSEEIKKMPVQTLAEVLTYVLGVDLRQRGVSGVQTDIQIQGSTFDQVLVMIDGVKMSDPQTGHHQMNLSLSPEAIERIEIIKGAASRKYGLNAMAGVVNIVTKSESKSKFTAQIYAGSNGTKDKFEDKLYANQGIRIFNITGGKALSAWYDISADLGSGYRYNSGFQSIRSNFKIQQILQSKFLNHDGFKLVYSGGIVRNAFGANGFYAAPSDSNAFEYVNTNWASVNAELETRKSGTLSFRISARGNSDQYVFIKSNPSYYRNFHQTSVLNPEINYRFTQKFYEIGAGLEYRKESINSTNLGEHIREFAGFYTDVLLKPIKGLRISGGLYGLSNSVIGFKLYPGADINFQLIKGAFLFASSGKGQRLPTFTDLYYTGPSNLSNALLQAERASYYDAGIRTSGKKLSAHLSLFSRKNNQLIDRVKDSLNALWRPLNLQEFTVRGLEVNFKYSSLFKKVLKSQGGLALNASMGISLLYRISLNSGKISQFTLNYLPLQCLTQLNLTAKHLGLSANGRYLERYGLTGEESYNYFIIDVRIDWKMLVNSNTAFKLFACLQNIGNTKYRDFTAIQLPGRWVSFGIAY